MTEKSQSFDWSGAVIFVSVTLFLILIVMFVIASLHDFEAKLNACKEEGYDGIRFISRYSNEVECANITESEKVFRNRGIK